MGSIPSHRGATAVMNALGENMPDGMKKPIYGAINVPLAVFWSKPYEDLIYKDISCQAAVNTAVWSESLNTGERLWLVGKVDTTALYGERVIILDCQGDWLRVAAVSQPTEHNELGYPGWVIAGQVCCNPGFLSEQTGLAEAVIKVPKATLFTDSTLMDPYRSLSYQTRLPIVTETESAFKVRLPDGTGGYLALQEAKKAAKLCFSGQNIVEEAKRFLGLKYLWGGTSSYGFDCSGFMFRLYQSQGISIPRDASEQAKAGIAIHKNNLQPGDLLFFATDNSPEKIHHVGMYIGDGLMVHSPNSKSAIRIESFKAGIYGDEYWGARRYC